MLDSLAGPEAPAPSIREFLYHVHAQRGRAAAAFGLVLVAFLAIAALLPPSYRARATLAVLPAPEFTVRGSVGSHDLNASALALDQIMKAETAILDSDDLHEATLRSVGPSVVYPAIFTPRDRAWPMRLAIAAAKTLLSPWRVTPADKGAAQREKALRRFEADLQLLPAKDANIISIAFDNPHGTVAAATINTMLALYAARRSRLYDDPQVEVVRKAVQSEAAALALADQAVATFKHDHGISDYAQQRDMVLHRRSLAEQALADAEASRTEQAARVAMLTRQLNSEPATIAMFREQDPDTRLLAVNAGLQDSRAKLASAREKYLNGSRMVKMLRAQIGAQEAEARRLGHDPAASVVRQGRNPNLESLRLDRARAATELAAARARITAERAQATDIAGALSRLDAAETGLQDVLRQRAAAEDNVRNATRILAERHLSEAEDALRLANVRVIQPAAVPQTPRALPLLVVLAGCVFGVLAAFARVAGSFVLHPVFLTGDGLERATGLPVLAVFERREAPVPQHEFT